MNVGFWAEVKREEMELLDVLVSMRPDVRLPS